MVKDEPVSLTRQTIYCIIPILDLYAAYRVTRLRKYLLIMILVGIPVTIADSLIFPVTVDENLEGLETYDILDYGYDSNHIAVLIGIEIGMILFAIFLVRRWSKQWNQKFQSST